MNTVVPARQPQGACNRQPQVSHVPNARWRIGTCPRREGDQTTRGGPRAGGVPCACAARWGGNGARGDSAHKPGGRTERQASGGGASKGRHRAQSRAPCQGVACAGTMGLSSGACVTAPQALQTSIQAMGGAERRRHGPTAVASKAATNAASTQGTVAYRNRCQRVSSMNGREAKGASTGKWASQRAQCLCIP